jgi:hypothetical protein
MAGGGIRLYGIRREKAGFQRMDRCQGRIGMEFDGSTVFGQTVIVYSGKEARVGKCRICQRVELVYQDRRDVRK